MCEPCYACLLPNGPIEVHDIYSPCGPSILGCPPPKCGRFISSCFSPCPPTPSRPQRQPPLCAPCYPPCCSSSGGCCRPSLCRPKVEACSSRELRGGILYPRCDCVRRNGLQADCPRRLCQGSPWCLTIPKPRCCPSRYART